MPLNIDTQELLSVIEPYVVRKFKPTDSEWLKAVRTTRHNTFKLRLKRQTLGLFMGRYRRTQEGLAINYSSQWLDTPLEKQLSTSNKAVYCEWNDEGYLLHTAGLKRIYHHLFTKALTELKPESVLEVGAGNGVNLLLLAGAFPNTKFAGIELSKGGVQAAQEIQKIEILPQYLRDFATSPILDLKAHQRIHFIEGSAAEIPLDDKSVDLVISSIALEQMEEVRNEVLKEISRVAKKHVVLIEPFRDWNNSGIKRNYIVAKDYFSARVSDLRQYGIEPIFTSCNLPHKLTYHPGLVVGKA